MMADYESEMPEYADAEDKQHDLQSNKALMI